MGSGIIELYFLTMASLSFAIPGMTKKFTENWGTGLPWVPSFSPHLHVGVGCALGLVTVAIKKTLNNVQSATLQLVTESRIVHNE